MSKYLLDAVVTIKISDLEVYARTHYSRSHVDSLKEAVMEAIENRIRINKNPEAVIDDIVVNDVVAWNEI